MKKLHVLRNLFWAIGILWREAKIKVLLSLFMEAMMAVFSFLTGVWLVQYAIKGIELHRPFYKIALVIVLVYAGKLLYSLLCYISNYYCEKIDNRVEQNLKLHFWKLVLQFPVASYDDPEFYQKYSQTIPDATTRITNTALEIVNEMIYRFITFVSNLSILSLIDPWLISLAVIPIFTDLFFGKKINRLSYQYTMEQRTLEEGLEYIDRVHFSKDYAGEMRMTNMKDVFMKRFLTDMSLFRKNISRFGIRIALFMFLSGVCRKSFGYYGGLLYGAVALLKYHSIYIGDAAILSPALGQLTDSLRAFSDLYIQSNAFSLYIDNLRDFIKQALPAEQKEIVKLQAFDDFTIAFRDVNFSYPSNSKAVLKDVCFQIKSGEKIAIVGLNGAGKSTLIQLLLRLYDPITGEITFNNVNIKHLDMQCYQKQFATVFQENIIFALSIKDNVLMGEAGTDEEVIQALRSVGVYDRVQLLPNGIHTVMTKEYDENGAVFSGGELQKICLARAAVTHKKIVILDEPSSALDPIAEAEFYNNLDSIIESKTVLFISHRMSAAIAADKILVLHDGRIVELGTHQELLAHNGHYAELFRLQASYYAEQETSV